MPLSSFYDRRDHVYYPTVAKAGWNKTVLCFKTTKFVKGRDFRLNGFDVRSRLATFTNGTGQIWRSGSSTPLIVWSGCPAGWLCSQYSTYDVPQVTLDELEMQRALVSAVAKAKTPEADVGMMISELKETLNMIASPAKTLVNLMRKMHKRPRRGPSLSISDIASKWLEYRYGVMPLISDIQSLIDFYDLKHLKIRGKLYKSSGREQPVETDVVTNVGPVAVGFSGMYMIGTKRVKTERFTTAHYYYRPFMNYTSVGSDIEDIPNLLWEKIPYSFVVDWFLNIGEWLATQKLMPGMEVMGNSVFTMDRTTEWYNSTMACNRVGTTPWSPCVSEYKIETVRGYRHVHMPLPSTPLVNSRIINLKRSFDSVSLIWQQLPDSLNFKLLKR